MNNTISKEIKIDFINWFMLNYDIADAAGYWILRKILQKNSASGLIKRTHFTKDLTTSDCLMIAASVDYDGIDEEDFLCTIDGEPVTYRSMHTYLLNNPDKELYIHLKYNGYKECKRLDKLISHKMISIDDILCDIFLDMLIAKRKLTQLNEEIDQSLLTIDSHKFYLLAAEKEKLLKNNPLL